MSKNSDNIVFRKTEKYTIEISAQSGFCFGVVNAIENAEEQLKNDEALYCLGDIVHNEQEVERLKKLGLTSITLEELDQLKNAKIMFRAHGEPPQRYSQINNQNLELVDATCPVVLKLQQRIKAAWERMKKVNGQMVIYGKPGHAEVVGLQGQTNNEAIVVADASGLGQINFEQPMEIFSQTTRDINEYKKLVTEIEKRSKAGVKVHDTICRQVSNRAPKLQEFAKKHDLVYFVGGLKSSNAQLLFKACKAVNPETYFVSAPEKEDWNEVHSKKRIGICGATSTPFWLMEEVAKRVEQELEKNV